MNSIWHSHFFRHWRAGWRLYSVIAGVQIALAIPTCLIAWLISLLFPAPVREQVYPVVILLCIVTVLPYFYHRWMHRLGYGALDMISVPLTTTRPESLDAQNA